MSNIFIIHYEKNVPHYYVIILHNTSVCVININVIYKYIEKKLDNKQLNNILVGRDSIRKNLNKFKYL